MINYKKGNLMHFTEDAFGHGCNCMKRMGKGVAKFVKEQYPELYMADQNSPVTENERLGSFTTCKLRNGKIGYNIYSQFDYRKQYGDKDININYKALEDGIELVLQDVKEKGLKSLALPKIGAGLAGGDWKIIENIINKLSEKYADIPISIYEL